MMAIRATTSGREYIIENNDELGDYIIYSAFPAYKVFIDGRLDMYGAERMREYYTVIEFRHGWEDIMKKYNIQWIFYDNKSPFKISIGKK